MRHQRVEERACEDGASVCPQALGEQPLDPESAEEEQRREDRKSVVVELGGGEGEDGEADQEPEEQEQHRPLARRLRPDADAGQHRRRAGKSEYPGKAVETDLLDEIRERAARRRRVHAEGQALEVVVDDEALEERLALVVAAVEGEHRPVPGRADEEDDQRTRREMQAAQAMPLAGDDAVDQRHRARQREAEEALGERREAHEAVERGGPAVVRLVRIVEQDDHQARHGAFEEPDEHRVRHGLAGEEDEQRAGEDGDRSDHGAAAGEQPIGHDEQQDGAHRRDGRVGQAYAPLGEHADEAVGAVGVHRQHARRHQPEVERGLGEEPGGLPPGMDVVAARDHLARHLAVMRLPRVPEAGGAEPGHVEQRGEDDETDGQAPLGAQRQEPAKPGDLAHEPGERLCPFGLRLRVGVLLEARHRLLAAVARSAPSSKRRSRSPKHGGNPGAGAASVCRAR